MRFFLVERSCLKKTITVYPFLFTECITSSFFLKIIYKKAASKKKCSRSLTDSWLKLCEPLPAGFQVSLPGLRGHRELVAKQPLVSVCCQMPQDRVCTICLLKCSLPSVLPSVSGFSIKTPSCSSHPDSPPWLQSPENCCENTQTCSLFSFHLTIVAVEANTCRDY